MAKKKSVKKTKKEILKKKKNLSKGKGQEKKKKSVKKLVKQSKIKKSKKVVKPKKLNKKKISSANDGIKKRKRGRPKKNISNKTTSFEKKRRKYTPKILRGMKDVLPKDTRNWEYVLKKAVDLAKSYGFGQIISPVLEEQSLFEKSTGLTSDVVQKQMYQFIDQGGNKVVLRPELTPSIVRAYIEQGMFNFPQPVKLYYFGPLFRYERPQTGRLRQFNQFGLEIVGSDKPSVEAQLILFSQILFNTLNLKVKIQINSLGCAECRQFYRGKLINYLKSKKKFLCDECQKRLRSNPLRILDCKEKFCQDVVSQAPQLVDDLCPDCRQHFVKTLEYLDEANVIYKLNPYLVRGLDYYTRTVFEFLPDREGIEKKQIKTNNQGKKEEVKEEEEKVKREEERLALSAQSALGGGGRYDTLVENLGGRPTPAAGLAYGFERIIEEINIQGITIPKIRTPQVFLAQIGELACRRALKIFEELRSDGFKIAENIAKDSLKAQMELADKMGVKLTLILGQQEVLDKTIIIRNMHTGNQEIVDQEKLSKELRKRLK